MLEQIQAGRDQDIADGDGDDELEHRHPLRKAHIMPIRRPNPGTTRYGERPVMKASSGSRGGFARVLRTRPSDDAVPLPGSGSRFRDGDGFTRIRQSDTRPYVSLT